MSGRFLNQGVLGSQGSGLKIRIPSAPPSLRHPDAVRLRQSFPWKSRANCSLAAWHSLLLQQGFGYLESTVLSVVIKTQCWSLYILPKLAETPFDRIESHKLCELLGKILLPRRGLESSSSDGCLLSMLGDYPEGPLPLE